MKIILEPLNIGANDLRRAVDISYCDFIDVLSDSIFGSKKWLQYYGIISQGCVYLYKNHNSRKLELSFSLSLCTCVEECVPTSGENICFCLSHKNGQAPMMLACDTMERRKKWIDKLSAEITHVLAAFNTFPKSEITDEQSPFYNLSADSGYGSAGGVPRLRSRSYDEVDETRCNIEALQSPTHDINRDNEIPSPVVRQKRYDRSDVLNRTERNLFDKRVYSTDSRQHTQKKEHSDVKPITFIEELNMAISKRHDAHDSMSLTSGESFLDVRKGSFNIDKEESQTANLNDSDVRSVSDNTSPKTIYENLEEEQIANQHTFKENEYFYAGQGCVNRLLKKH